jgi:nitroimidazol reductase NimA-like FMN-containing flavoprotein (pyridoxamine 5'-phosphate oxidase superfamily)
MEKQFDKIRRTDRQETDSAFLYQLLENSTSCTVAVATAEYPLVQATFFAFDKMNNEVIFHFSKYGFSGQEIMTGKNITISVYKSGKLYTAEKAVDFGGEYQSVIIYRKIRVVDHETEKMQAMQIFFDKYFADIPASDYKPFTVTEANPIHVVKVKIKKWIGKQHILPPSAIQSFYPESSPVI